MLGGLDQQQEIEVIDLEHLRLIPEDTIDDILNEVHTIFILKKSLISRVSPQQNDLILL